MLLVRVILILLVGGAVLARLLGLSVDPPANGDPSGDAGADPPSNLDETIAAATGQELPDNARQRAPWLVRFSIGLAPLVGFLGFAFAVLGFVARNAELTLPVVGPVVGDWPLGVLLLSIAVWAVWLLWQVPRWQAAAWRRSAELKEREVFDIENSSRATLGQILSGVAVLAGLIFAWQQLGNTSQTLFVSQEGQITDRFSRAVGQLGDDDLTIRLGGIYALERIARDSERDHETVMEILAAFARGQSAAESGPGTPVAGVGGDNDSLSSIRDIPLDVDVVLKVIFRRDSSRDGVNCIDLSDMNLDGFQLGGSSFDLTNICLRDAKLRGAELVGADFSGADLARTDFTGANLDHANLSGAQLSRTIFEGANLSRANLTGANLTGANLQRALLEGTILRDAILNGTDLSYAFMPGADLQGANLMGANLEGASMLGVDMRGTTNLTVEQADAATLDGASQLPPEVAATPDF